MSDFQDAYDAGLTQKWHRPDLPASINDRAIVLTDGQGNERIEYLPIEALTGQLAEKRGTVNFLDVRSFNRYVLAHMGDGTRVFVNPATQTIVAVLDGHGKAPGWGRHRAVLVTQPTRVWQEWMKFAADFHEQVPFAHFIESHITEIAEPDGATLLDMVTTLEVKVGAHFASATKLQNGQVQLTYNEQIEGTTQKGNATLPENLSLVMMPVEGSRAYPVHAKLRYRMREGQLRLRVELHRPLDVLEAAFEERVVELANLLGDRVIFFGDAPAEIAPVVRK